MERAVVDGITLEYKAAGRGEPVILIHGVLIADAFRPLVAEPFLVHRYRLVTYHRRGYGDSSRPLGPVSVARQAADCRALLRHLGVERAHVVGHSFGGAVALQLALDAPDLVRSLALLEPALVEGPTLRSYRHELARAKKRYRTEDPAMVVDGFLCARYGAAYRAPLDRVLPGAFEQAVAGAAPTFALDIPALLAWRFGEAEARRIVQPVLAVLGSQSDALSPRLGETNRLLRAWLPHAEGFVLPDAAHGLQLQNPRGMAEALAGFFARHPIPARSDDRVGSRPPAPNRRIRQ